MESQPRDLKLFKENILASTTIFLKINWPISSVIITIYENWTNFISDKLVVITSPYEKIILYNDGTF
jgi:hypothetical protein